MAIDAVVFRIIEAFHNSSIVGQKQMNDVLYVHAINEVHGVSGKYYVYATNRTLLPNDLHDFALLLVVEVCVRLVIGDYRLYVRRFV